MRTAHDYKAFPKVILRNYVFKCLVCGKDTDFAYRSRRHLFSLDGGQDLHYDVRRCPNKNCHSPKPGFYPAALSFHAVARRDYSLDVLARIGLRRVQQSLTFAQIAQELRQLHRIQISVREVQYLYDVYLAMISTPVDKDPVRLKRLKDQGRIVLSIDAAQPEMDSDALWLFRDQISGEPLRAWTCRSINAEGIAQNIRKVKMLGIRIPGVISDGQKIIMQAVEKALPGVPHQLCQLHFLQDFAKPVTEADRELHRGLKQEVGRGLRAFERAAERGPKKRGSKAAGAQIPAPTTVVQELATREAAAAGAQLGASEKLKQSRPMLEAPLDQQEAYLVERLCELTRAILKTPGRPPLETPGLQAYQDLKRVLVSLEQAAPKKKPLVEAS